MVSWKLATSATGLNIPVCLSASHAPTPNAEHTIVLTPKALTCTEGLCYRPNGVSLKAYQAACQASQLLETLSLSAWGQYPPPLSVWQ